MAVSATVNRGAGRDGAFARVHGINIFMVHAYYLYTLTQEVVLILFNIEMWIAADYIYQGQ